MLSWRKVSRVGADLMPRLVGVVETRAVQRRIQVTNRMTALVQTDYCIYTAAV